MCVGVVLNHPGSNVYGAAFLAPQTRGPQTGAQGPALSRRDAVLAAAGLAGIPAAAAAVPPFMVPGLMDAVEDKVRKAQVAQGPPPVTTARFGATNSRGLIH